MLTFPNVTPAVFEAVLNELRKDAIINEDAAGNFTIKGSGILAMTRLYPSGQLYVDIQDKPWWMPEAVIAAKIEQAIASAQTGIGRKG